MTVKRHVVTLARAAISIGKGRLVFRPPARATEPLFDHMTDQAMLCEAWRRVRSNRGAPGGDRLAISAFDVGAARRLRRLREALREGSYRPGTIRTAFMPKPDGRWRQLSIPCVIDRIAQTAAMMVLTPVLEPEMSARSFAYRPKRSVDMAIDQIYDDARSGFVWVVDGDIETFFDVVDHRILMRRLEQSVDDARLLDVLKVWLRSFSASGKGLAQGSPISPLLSNVYLGTLDSRIAQSRATRWIRYADDFVILCRTERAARRARARIAHELTRHGLALNAEKTRIASFETGFRFLGHDFAASAAETTG